ncbi:MAG TPA: hypothetical protein VK497_04935 [Candidatus Saccharimonadales bacterium]|nr:hypothetical protein [Candidatus Saccharimonadales bacterium]
MVTEIKKTTALLRGTITGRVVTLDQMMAAHAAGYGGRSTPLPMVVRTKDDREFRLGLVVTGVLHRVSGDKTLCDFAGVVQFVSGIGVERLKGVLVQGTIDLSCTLAVTDCQGRLECLRPVLAEVA